MAAVQAKIPFRSRKKVSMNCKNNLNNEENWDHRNCIQTDDGQELKRAGKRANILLEKTHVECSPNKISRLVESPKELCGDKQDCYSEKASINEIRQKPLPSRETEIEYLEQFLMEHLENKNSGSLYVSGQPGTGKTASLTYILQLPKIKEEYLQVYVNCTMMKSAASIFIRICKELNLSPSGSTEKACRTAIEKYLTKSSKMILMVLDEIDQLDSKRQSILYTIFEWPAVKKSRLVLIGVANALDLTERALPRLQGRCSLRPKTLHFPPYTKQQIINIFTTILLEEDKTSMFSPVALQMLAAKIAAVSGDMRRALDIGRRVIELAKRNNFKENQSIDTIMKDATVTVEIKQVLEVLNDVYGGSTNIETDVDEGFPMQQKLILCSLLLLLDKGKNKDVNIGKLYDVYKKVARSRNIAPLETSEMVHATSLLESRGALRLGAGAAGARARRLRLQWDRGDVVVALRDKPLLAAILDDRTVLRE